MKTPLGTEADLCPGHILLDGVTALRERDTAPPLPPMSIVAMVAHLRLLSSCMLAYMYHFTFPVVCFNSTVKCKSIIKRNLQSIKIIQIQ